MARVEKVILCPTIRRHRRLVDLMDRTTPVEAIAAAAAAVAATVAVAPT